MSYITEMLSPFEAKGYEITISNSLPHGVWSVRVRSGDLDFTKPPRLYVNVHAGTILAAIERAVEKVQAIETGALRSPYGDEKPKATATAASLTDMLSEEEEEPEPETELEGMLS